jgi:hypothetical protein
MIRLCPACDGAGTVHAEVPGGRFDPREMQWYLVVSIRGRCNGIPPRRS